MMPLAGPYATKTVAAKDFADRDFPKAESSKHGKVLFVWDLEWVTGKSDTGHETRHDGHSRRGGTGPPTRMMS